ncbi:MAG: TetR/AcrR family transcriptional regulator [Fibromonadaceae bacterium]|jgi:AcrR family transcriptional regulator|nr:TetR/AcrR family transcriptional regulator [Fibromonadaceae bacterium]
MRVIKKPEVRKAEILDAAEKLFNTKGYETATINDILIALNISKGAFYHYFKSKEEVLDESIEKYISERVSRAEKIAVSSLSPVQKFFEIISGQKLQSKTEEIFLPSISSFNEKDNAKMHKKIITEYISRLSPCLSKIVKEGIDVGLFSTSLPNESVEIILAAGLVLLNYDFFPLAKEKMEAKAVTFLTVTERILGAKTGVLSELFKPPAN